MEEKNLNKIQDESNSNKNRNLILGIVFDAIGMVSFMVPFLGEFSDVGANGWISDDLDV